MKKMKAIGMAIGIAGLGVAGGFLLDQPEPQVIEVEKQVPFEVVKEVAVPYNVTEEVIVEKEVEKIIEVPLNGTDDVVEFIVDENGNINELDIDEIEDKGFDELISQVAFIQESKMMAVYEVESELSDELDRRTVQGVELDEDDIERIRVNDDLDELEIDDINFDEKDADVTVTGSFEHDDEEYDFEVLIEIKDGQVDDFDVISVTKQ